MRNERLSQIVDEERAAVIDAAVKSMIQSPNWEKYKNIKRPLAAGNAPVPKDWPFEEGFPNTSRAHDGNYYLLIDWQSDWHIAYVDFPTRKRYGSPKWQKVTPGLMPDHQGIIAWKEYTPVIPRAVPALKPRLT